MFKMMKQITETAADLRPVKGLVLGTRSARALDDKIDAPSQVLISFCAYSFGELNGRILISLERHFKIAPNDKPALRKLISDRFEAPPSLAASQRQLNTALKGANINRHHQIHVLMNGLCKIAYDSGHTGRASIQRLIEVGKSLGLSQDEILTIFQKTRLAA